MGFHALAARLRFLASFRDSFLLVSGGAYVAGYAVWALVGLRLGLGAPPVLDAQYFVAGIPPLVILSITVFFATRLSRFLLQVWPQRWAELSPVRQFGATIVPLVVWGLCWLVYSRRSTLLPKLDLTEDSLAIGLVAIGLLASCLLPPNAARVYYAPFLLRVPPGRIRNLLKRFPADLEASQHSRALYSIYAITIGLGILIVLGYINYIYPVIPQALGGAKPRCAILDIDATEFSLESLQSMTSGTAHPGTDVVTTVPLRIIFASHDSIVVSAPNPGRDYELRELPRDIVKSIAWCTERLSLGPLTGTPNPSLQRTTTGRSPGCCR